MRIVFLNLSPMSSNAGHLARFKLELDTLQDLHQVYVICLGKKADDEQTKKEYPKVNFEHFPIEFSGWKVEKLDEVADYISEFTEKVSGDLVVLQMEVWDLMRALSVKLKDKIAFATITHAMPFLGSPIDPSGNFGADVLKYIDSGIDQYRKNYTLENYSEAESVLRNISLIANNKTVEYYLKLYFPELKISVLAPSLVSKLHNEHLEKPTYDFAYMARMEKGKGLEYLKEILITASKILSRKVSLVIMGRQDDAWSKETLASLLSEFDHGTTAEIIYLGWADEKTKKETFPKCGVFLYPSVYDNYPTVLNEALSFSLPVVTWDVPFYRLNYSRNVAVLVAQPLDITDFAEKAIYALERRKELSEEARNFSESFMSPAEVAASDSEVFKNIILGKDE